MQKYYLLTLLMPAGTRLLAVCKCHPLIYMTNAKRGALDGKEQTGYLTYSPRAMQHPYTKVPEEKLAIIPNTSETVVPVIASPRVECNCCDPRIMSLTAGDNLAIG